MSCIDATAEVQAVALSYIWYASIDLYFSRAEPIFPRQGLFSMTFGSGLAVAGGHYVATTTDKPVFRRIVLAATILEVLHVLMAVTDTAYVLDVCVRARLISFTDGLLVLITAALKPFTVSSDPTRAGKAFTHLRRVSALSPFYVANMVIGAVLACLVQSFYAWRVYRLLGKRLVLLFGLGLLITFAFVSMIVAQMIAYNSADPGERSMATLFVRVLTDKLGLFMSGAQTTEAFLYMRLPYVSLALRTLRDDAESLLRLPPLLLTCVFVASRSWRFIARRQWDMPKELGSKFVIALCLMQLNPLRRIVKRLVVLTITSNGLTTTYCIILLATSLRATEAFW